MVESMLTSIIAREFEKKIPAVLNEGRYVWNNKALHIGFRLFMLDEKTNDTRDQYVIDHMYLYQPTCYVFVAMQREIITHDSIHQIEPMKLLTCHDSCWRDAIGSYIFNNRAILNGFMALTTLFDWCDVIELKPSEQEYLNQLTLRDVRDGKKVIRCPLDAFGLNRSVWK